MTLIHKGYTSLFTRMLVEGYSATFAFQGFSEFAQNKPLGRCDSCRARATVVALYDPAGPSHLARFAEGGRKK